MTEATDICNTRSTPTLDELIRRDLRRKAWFVAIVATILILWPCITWSGAAVLSAVSNNLIVLLPVWWAISARRRLAGHRLPIERDEQRSLRRWACDLCGIGLLTYPLGSMFYYYYEFHGEAPFLSIADAFFYSTYPFLIPGILLLAARGMSGVARGRLLLDTLLVTVYIAAFSWFFVLGPILVNGADSMLETVLAAAYPAFDLTMIFCALFISSRIVGQHAWRVSFPLTIGLVSNVIADTWWGIEIRNDTYQVGEVVDAFWPIGFMLIGLGVRANRLLPFLAGDETSLESSHARPSSPVWRSLLPYALLPAIVVLVIYNANNESHPWIRNCVYASSLVLLCLLLVRQLLAIQENVDLNRQLRTTLDDLHASH